MTSSPVCAPNGTGPPTAPMTAPAPTSSSPSAPCPTENRPHRPPPRPRRAPPPPLRPHRPTPGRRHRGRRGSRSRVTPCPGTPVWPNATRSSTPSSPRWSGASSGPSRTIRTTSSTGSGPGGGWGPDVLPSTDDHERRYLTAAVEHLRDAARSGATFAGGKPDDAPPVDAVAGELAAAIVVPLRRRLDGAGGSVDVGDDSALIEHVGAAFRDWKGGRVERLAGDQALAAFSQASLAAAPSTDHVAVDRRRRGNAVPRLRRQRAGGTPPSRRGVPDRASLPAGPRRLPLPPGSGRGVGSDLSALPARSVSPAASLGAPGACLDRRRRRRPDRPHRLVEDARHLLHRLPVVRLGPPQWRMASSLRRQDGSLLRLRPDLLRLPLGEPGRGRPTGTATSWLSVPKTSSSVATNSG